MQLHDKASLPEKASLVPVYTDAVSLGQRPCYYFLSRYMFVLKRGHRGTCLADWFDFNASRLMGWRLDPQRRGMIEMVANRKGWLWSEQLESWLVLNEAYLRLYDRDQQMRLAGEEAQAQRAEIEAGRAEAAIRKIEALAEKLCSLGINPDEI